MAAAWLSLGDPAACSRRGKARGELAVVEIVGHSDTGTLNVAGPTAAVSGIHQSVSLPGVDTVLGQQPSYPLP